MSDLAQSDSASRFRVRPTAESHFSWIRTRLSLERTLMSWIRTAISLIGFGFTIVQFFERLGTSEKFVPPMLPEAPRYVGLALIATGVLALAISAWQYFSSLRYLRGEPFDRIAVAKSRTVYTPILAVCFALMLIGIAAFLAILTRIA